MSDAAAGLLIIGGVVFGVVAGVVATLFGSGWIFPLADRQGVDLWSGRKAAVVVFGLAFLCIAAYAFFALS